ncbi:hypothetical protein ACFQE5_20115 [Pseudonocardia hispaniensis]|uniref:Uncharacterized protein n=1 Tax=Pseudonocardia hispaniensis TaxID=904933 RepID=A0ABW1J826_9PSEU
MSMEPAVERTELSLRRTECPPFSASGIARQVAEVVDPLAARYRGWPEPTIRRILQRSWRQAFGAPLEGPVLDWCAQAIETGRPWQRAMWGTGPD